MHILLLEDDKEIGHWIENGLNQSGHVTDWVEDGRDALVSATTRSYDVIILDRMTPGLDGLSVLRSLRSAKNATPVLFLTAMGDIDDRVEGLEAGGDDYLTKPFAFTELLARVNALGRRSSGQDNNAATTLCAGDLTLDLLKRSCSRKGQKIELKAKEFLLLETFLRNKGRILTKNMLLERIWNMNFDPTTSVVETHISRLRAKIEKPFGDTVIRTVRGAGYVIDS